MAITIIVTNAGRAALVNAVNTGTNAVTITQLGITEAVFAPTAAQVALPGEIKRIPLASGVVVADDQIHVTASDVTADAYAMRGFALYLNDGTLFAIYGQAGAILNKTAQSMMLLAADIAFADIDAELIEFGDTNFILPPATTEILGLVELATTAEAQAGADASRVLTPLTGKQSVLGWLLSQDGSGSGLDADLLDGLHASAFALAGHAHGTMATQNSNNVDITGGALNNVTLGTVNGSAASPALFFSSDTDTGIYRAGTDAIAIATGGVHRVRVNSAGAVGIGTGAPSGMLHVVTSGTKQAYFTDADHSSLANLSAALVFPRPDGGATSAILSAAPAGSPGAMGGLAICGRDGVTIATGGASLYGATVARVTITGSGDVGIGTDSPGAPLHLRGGPAGATQLRLDSSATQPNIAFYNGDANVGNRNWAIVAARVSYGDLTFVRSNAAGGDPLAAGSTMFRILANGQQQAADGNGGAPSYSFANDPDTGIYANGGNSILFATGGATRAAIDSFGRIVPNTDNGQDFGWVGGRWKTGYFGTSVEIAGNTAWHAGNFNPADYLARSGGAMGGAIQGANGTAENPGFSFVGDYRMGMYRYGPNILGFSVGGSPALLINNAGTLFPPGNGSQPFGAPSGQWATGYFTGLRVSGNDVWHSGNDGSGSGLDADLLDGQQGNYYLPAASYTPGDVRAKLLTVDGSGSGIDADMLDGLHASDFRRIVQQSLSEYDGYRVWSDGTKECWTRLTINENQSRTWALPVAHSSWVHPSLAISTVAITDVQDNTGITSINGAPPYSITFWNADNRTLTIWVRTLGV